MSVEARQAVTRSQLQASDPASDRYDVWLVLAAVTLLAIGLIMVASASVSIAERKIGDPLYYFYRQSLFVTFSVLIAAATLRVTLATWQKASPILLLLGIALLALVLVPGVGREVNGSVRWLSIGGVNLQPSELMKLFLALYLPAIWSAAVKRCAFH